MDFLLLRADSGCSPLFGAGRQFGIKSFDQRVLLQELQIFLQLFDVERCFYASSHAWSDIRSAQAFVADDINLAETGFYDAQANYAMGYPLIRN